MSEKSILTFCPWQNMAFSGGIRVWISDLGVIEMFSTASQPQKQAGRFPSTLFAAANQLDTSERRLGRLMPSDPKELLPVLRARFATDGYLFLKGLLHADTINSFRGWVFENLAESGLLLPGSDPVAGTANSSFDKALADRRLMSIVRSARYENFCSQPDLTHFIDSFIGGLSYLHKRKLVRFTMPNTSVATPAHYDLVYLRGGTSNILTSWIPIGDISVAEGGLVYLKDSHTVGVEMEREFSRKSADLSPEQRINAYNVHMTEGGWVSNNLPEMAEKFDTQWLAADYEAGDVVLHSPFMIHASTNNASPTARIRLSTDIRFQNVDDEIDARWSNHWSLDDML
jgi:ectoine hydroxylase-related dioxygenase (phytanoyl-CoA dioxygenase family)